MTFAIDLRGRRAVVTGAGKGIGRAITLALARAGADVFAVSRTEADLESLGREVARFGVRYAARATDLRDPEAAPKLAEVAVGELGAIDILVNNAGVAANAPAEHVTEAEWDMTMTVNVKAAFFCAQAIGRHMLERGYGRIVNVTSQAGIVALPEHAVYGASKAALGMLTKVLAVEWGARGVTVNAVAPTVILTPLGRRVWGDPSRGEPMLAKIPLGRFGEPPEVADLVTFLASDHAGLINGAIIPIDGGYTAQ